MTIRKIAHIGHPVLRQVSREITLDELNSEAVQRLIDDMIETMRDANGAGIAAPQVHEPLRICVLEVKDNPRYPYKPNIPLTVLVNPKLRPLSEDKFDNYEGCLSVPNLRGVVRRFGELRVEARDRHGEPIDLVARGFTAGTYQHEVDHLDGKLFVDRVEDPSTLCTWTEFERFHREGFLEKAQAIVAKYGG